MSYIYWGMIIAVVVIAVIKSKNFIREQYYEFLIEYQEEIKKKQQKIEEKKKGEKENVSNDI